MDRRKHYFLVLDTETANSLEQPLVYDMGWAIVDKYGNVYKTESFVNREIFFEEAELMQSSYYAHKLPLYYKRIAKGETKVANWNTIRKTLWQDIADYGIKEVVAHNARFDYLSTATTQRYLTSSKWRFFFPYGTKFLDTLKMARETFGKDENYIAFCQENGYLTAYNKPRFTAEILYRYLTNDITFEEAHTGLEDVEIETQIFLECIHRNPSVGGLLWE